MWKINAQPLALKTINYEVCPLNTILLTVYSVTLNKTLSLNKTFRCMYEICVLFQLHMIWADISCYLTHCFIFKTTHNYILGAKDSQIRTLKVNFHPNIITKEITISLIDNMVFHIHCTNIPWISLQSKSSIRKFL